MTGNEENVFGTQGHIQQRTHLTERVEGLFGLLKGWCKKKEIIKNLDYVTNSELVNGYPLKCGAKSLKYRTACVRSHWQAFVIVVVVISTKA